MGIVNTPCNTGGLVQRFTNSAYDIVKEVYDNLATIQSILDYVPTAYSYLVSDIGDALSNSNKDLDLSASPFNVTDWNSVEIFIDGVYQMQGSNFAYQLVNTGSKTIIRFSEDIVVAGAVQITVIVGQSSSTIDASFTATLSNYTLKPSSKTTVELTDVTDAINTTDKYLGKMVWDSTAGFPMFATGDGAADTWVDANGANTISPV